MKKVIFLCLFTLSLTFSFAHDFNFDVSCGTPTNVTKTFQSSGSVSFTWDACDAGCTGFEVQYVRLSDGYTSSLQFTSTAGFMFTGLSAGEYEFRFRKVCDAGVSGFIVIEDEMWI